METTTRHKYEYKVDPNADTAAAKVVRMVGADKRILEIGAGPGSITRLLKSHNNCQVTAIELDDEAIAKLSEFCEKVYQCDLNDPLWPSVVSEHGKFDVVIAADVLEHLYDPWATLQNMKTILEESGHIVVSLPHVGHSAVIACQLNADFAYQEWGLLDKTHIRFFGIKNIQNLFKSAGLKIVGVEFVVRTPEQTEFAANWRALSANMKRCLSENKYGNVYQVVVKAAHEASPETELNITSLAVPAAGSGFSENATIKTRLIERLKSHARSRLSFETRARIANRLNKVGIKL